MTHVHAVVPDGLDDPRRPSGGNVYDRKVLHELECLGWVTHEHPVPGPWGGSRGSPAAARPALEDVLRRREDRALVLIDSLVVAASPDLVASAGDRLRLVVLVHMPWGYHHPDVAADERAAFSAATCVVTTSRWTRDWLQAEYGLRAAVLHVVEPGVDRAGVAPGTDAGGELLCVGAVIPGKGHDLLLSALAEVSDLRWRCLCVGALDVEEDYAAGLGQTVRRLGLSDRVRFTGPRVGVDLDRTYAESDVLVLASRSETYGMVVAEALAHGLPVVAADVGGVAEALGGVVEALGGVVEALGRAGGDGCLPGMLVPAESPGALAAALRRWLADPEHRRRLRRLANRRRLELAGWSDAARAFADILARVSAEPPGPPRRKAR
ncbi:MAG: glycosyltransferase family 4 protein [Actinomycetes bacterium]